MIGRRCLGRVGGGMAVGLGGGVSDRGCDGTVEQHARFQRHDQRRSQRPLAFGYLRLCLLHHMLLTRTRTVVNASMKNAAIN
jgi:hypothetical protein